MTMRIFGSFSGFAEGLPYPLLLILGQMELGDLRGVVVGRADDDL